MKKTIEQLFIVLTTASFLGSPAIATEPAPGCTVVVSKPGKPSRVGCADYRGSGRPDPEPATNPVNQNGLHDRG